MIGVHTEEGRSIWCDTRQEANMHWEMLEANGWTPVEFTGDI